MVANGGFDVVLGNPPYLNQMASATTRGGSSPHGGGPYADAAAEFLALAIRLTRPGGRVGLVLPQSLLSARDAEPIRRFIDEHAALRWMWWSDDHVFDASVRVFAAGGPAFFPPFFLVLGDPGRHLNKQKKILLNFELKRLKN